MQCVDVAVEIIILLWLLRMHLLSLQLWRRLRAAAWCLTCPLLLAPFRWPWLLRVLPAEYLPVFDDAAFTVALAVTAGALLVASRPYRFPASDLFTWTSSLTVFWVLLSTLWMPWLDLCKCRKIKQNG